MHQKLMSGHCRLTVIVMIVLLALCVASAGGASTTNTNLGIGKAVVIQVTTTQAVYVGTTPDPMTWSVCPTGYDCLTEADASAQLGAYEKYSDTVCGYKQSTAMTTALVRIPKYCVKKLATPTPVTCPDGCSCISQATADARGGTWSRCSSDVCGYEKSTATLAAVVSVPKYCMKQVSTTPSCPDGCVCISDAMAQQRYGEYTRCSADVCGYEQDQTPKYCIKQGSTTPVCPDGCTCLSDAKAKERYGTYTRCTADVCGYELNAATNALAAVRVPQYCVRQGATPSCPDGCTCISDEDATLKGLTERCDNGQTPCGYRTAAATATAASQRIPLYCYKIPVATTTPVPASCPEGCVCTTNATAVAKGLTFCSGKLIPCGYDANKQPQYCFTGESATTCPQGCTCAADTAAKEKGLTPCRGILTSCGSDPNNPYQHCFEQVPSPTCVYDYQKNACTGTCPEGYSCSILASEKDASGKVTYAVCGCTGQPAGQCMFDKEKQACTGGCQNGASCAIVGKNVDQKTGDVQVVCGCPQPVAESCEYDKEKKACTGTCQSGDACSVIGSKTDDKTGEVYTYCGCPPRQGSCSYDYSRDACAGTCTVTGETCQLNTIYRDPASGKVTYAECNCKGSGDSTPACALDANNRCSGTCPQGGQCTAATVKDDSGQEKTSCGCSGAQQATPAGTAARQQGILESIGSFFNRLFGGK